MTGIDKISSLTVLEGDKDPTHLIFTASINNIDVRFDIKIAFDGKIAVEKYKSTPHFDFLLSDQDMPHLKGDEFIGEVKKYNSNNNIKDPTIVSWSSSDCGEEIKNKFSNTVPFYSKGSGGAIVEDTVEKILKENLTNKLLEIFEVKDSYGEWISKKSKPCLILLYN